MISNSLNQNLHSVWVLNHGVELKYCLIRQTWLLLAPERIFILNSTAASALSLLDGVRTSKEVASILSLQFHLCKNTNLELDVYNLFFSLSMSRVLLNRA